MKMLKFVFKEFLILFCDGLAKQTLYNTISLSRHEQVCLIKLPLERYFSHHWAIIEVCLET